MNIADTSQVTNLSLTLPVLTSSTFTTVNVHSSPDMQDVTHKPWQQKTSVTLFTYGYVTNCCANSVELDKKKTTKLITKSGHASQLAIN